MDQADLGANALSVADVVAAAPTTWRMIGRALLLRCPRCGAGDQFCHWVHRRDHCPGCGYSLDRDSDSFFGAYLLNLCVSFASLFVLLMLVIFFEAAERPLPLAPVIAVGLFLAVGLPILFYPFGFTLWSVMDLRNVPLELEEISAAVDRLDDTAADDGRR